MKTGTNRGLSPWRTVMLTLGAGACAAWAASAAPMQEAKAPGVKVGDAAPAFKLTDLDGKDADLGELTKKGAIVVLEWFNPECEWVAKYHKDSRTLVDTQKKFAGGGVKWFAINSATAGSAADPEANRKAASDWGITYPILRDRDGRVAKMYGVTVNPHIFIIGADGRIAYSGAVDDAATVTTKGTRQYVAEALEALVSGETIKLHTTPPQGCPMRESR